VDIGVVVLVILIVIVVGIVIVRVPTMERRIISAGVVVAAAAAVVVRKCHVSKTMRNLQRGDWLMVGDDGCTGNIGDGLYKVGRISCVAA
jgi:hypothetical protein